ncbi:hypothetical protein IGI69_000047 [Enterococcus sp. DIV1083b]
MYLYSNMVPSKREVQFFHRYMKLMKIACFYDQKNQLIIIFRLLFRIETNELIPATMLNMVGIR